MPFKVMFHIYEPGKLAPDYSTSDRKLVEAVANEPVEQKPAWSAEDEEMLNVVMQSCEKCGNEYVVYWLKSLKDRLQLQPKQEWSEEDEKIKNRLINSLVRISANTRTDSTSPNYSFSKEIEWLKSLRPQKLWKPSEEQMEALKEACNEHWEPDGLDPLYTLYQDLKKLREE